MQSHVLERACEVAATNNAELYIGHVIDSTALQAAGSYPSNLIPDLDEAWRNSIAEEIAKIESMPGIAGVTVLSQAGRIRETLLDELIKPVDPDLVICGARGLSSIRYAFLGSISTFLLRSCDCDVLVVKSLTE